MCDFDTIGFLSPDLNRLEDDIKTAYPDQYKWVMKVNTFCQQLQYELEFRKENADQVVGATLFARAVATYQAFILLAMRGMHHQANILLRCLLECVFPLVAISKNPDYSKKLYYADQHDYLRSRKQLKRFLNRHSPDHQDLEVIVNQINEVKDNISKEECKKLTTRQIAQDANLEDWYDMVYSELSKPVHASVRSLEESLVFDDEKNINSLKNHPKVDDHGVLFLTSLSIMFYAIQAISAILNADTSALLHFN